MTPPTLQLNHVHVLKSAKYTTKMLPSEYPEKNSAQKACIKKTIRDLRETILCNSPETFLFVFNRSFWSSWFWVVRFTIL
jgi:hypothetical protein